MSKDWYELVPTPVAATAAGALATTAAPKAATTAAAALAPRTVGLGTRLVYRQIAASHAGAVQGFHRLFGGVVVRHFDKRKSAWLPGITIRDDANLFDRAILLKHAADLVFRRVKAQIPHIDILHGVLAFDDRLPVRQSRRAG